MHAIPESEIELTAVRAQGAGGRYLGDLDCSGVVDARDALLVLRFVSGNSSGDICH